MQTLHLRAAHEIEAGAIRALVRSERLNPTDLDWRRFLVAVDAGRLVGAVQMRKHPDGARELGSLVVHPDARGRGLSTWLIDTLLAMHSEEVHVITRHQMSARYARWGFRAVAAAAAPASVRRNYRIGSVMARFIGPLLFGRQPVRLAILKRPGRLA